MLFSRSTSRDRRGDAWWVRAGVGRWPTQAMGVRRGPASARFRRSPPTLGPPRRSIRRLPPTPTRTSSAWGRYRDGRAAAYTGAGAQCIEWAGHFIEDGFAVQGNMLANAEVLPAMRLAFLDTDAPLAERMMAALEAGQAAGGDRRLGCRRASRRERA